MSFEREEWRSDSNSSGTVTSEFQTIKIEELIFWSSGAGEITFFTPRLRRHPRLSPAELGRARLTSAELGRGRPSSNIKDFDCWPSSAELDGARPALKILCIFLISNGSPASPGPQETTFFAKISLPCACSHFFQFRHSDEENGPCEKSQVLGQRSGAELLKETKSETPDQVWSSEQRF